MSLFTQLTVLLLVAGVLWVLFALLAIRWFRKALHAEIAVQLRSLTEQVRAIAEVGPSSVTEARQAGPRIKEFAEVQRVIQSVRERVRATAEEQSRQIESLQIALHSDPVTGVANRKFFLNELQRSLKPQDDGAAALSDYGHVLIFRQRDLGSINARHERTATDAWLRNVAESVRQTLSVASDPGRPAPQMARLNGSDFVVLLSGYDGPDTTDLIESLRQALDALRIVTADHRLCRWSYALTDYSPHCDVGQILARLDHGLMRAENAGHDEVEYMASSEYRVMGATTPRGETAWKTLIQNGLREGRVQLNVQPSNYKNDTSSDRHEALLSLESARGGNAISGYLFMPPAVRLGLSGACDLRAVALGRDWVKKNPGTLALRISLASLLLPDFLSELERILDVEPSERNSLHRLILEIDAHGFVAYSAELDAFCQLAEKAGVGVGVRRLAEQPAALLRLHRVTIRYIKLGGELISHLLESPGAVHLIAAITEAAIGQGVKVYAHDVPNVHTAALLREYGVLLPVEETFPEEEEELEGEFVDV